MSRADDRGRWLPVDRLGRAAAARVPGWDRIATLRDGLSPTRVGALASAAGLLLSFLLVVYGVVDTVGDPALFYPAVLIPLVAATLLARSVRVRVAVGIGVALLAVGLAWHTLTLEQFPDPLLIVGSNIELLTGRQVLEIRQAGVWAIAITPTPVLVTWYLALRREYVAAALAGGAALGYLVLTGDAGTNVALLGVVSIAGLVGFGDLDNQEWSGGTPDYVAVVLALMIVTPLVITIVPGGTASPVSFGGGGSTTMEDNVVATDADLEIIGSVSQTPDVRFTVEADRARYWRTGSFDRYTGDGWVRSGGESAYEDGTLEEPPGETEYLLQRVDVETELRALPAAWRPVEVSTSVADRTEVTQNGGLQVDGTVDSGESYQVVSAVTNPTSQELVEAGTEYPDRIVERYTQLPESTPNRVGEQTAELVSEAETPYEAALTAQQWLRTNREYSLDVNRPDGNIADAFLFEMDAGYCTYYATTMVTMLRTQGIPARMAVGYNAGEPVEDDRYAVRGLNSHAWVEVYFPEIGWVPFEPTPPDPRQEVEQAAIQNARAGGSSTVDTAETEPDESGESGPGEITVPGQNRTGANESSIPDPGPALEGIPDRTGQGPAGPGGVEPGFNASVALGGSPGEATSNATDIDEEAGGSGGPALPPHEQLALGAIALIGAVAGLRQSRVVQRVSRAARIRFQRRRDPATDVERAHDRLLLLLERRYRSRRDGETLRQYFDAIDPEPRAKRVAELRERAQYGGDVSKAAADEAVSLVESIREDL
jgi:transglutaminase-like putative cysteine protease